MREDGGDGQRSTVLVQTDNIRTEGEENAAVQENYSDASAVLGKLPQISAGG